MTFGVVEDDFLDLCLKYTELAEDRRRLLTAERAAEHGADVALAEEIDDLDARQRILMWRILRSGVEDRAMPASEDRAGAAGRKRDTGSRETGGTVRGRFAAMTSPLTARWSIFAQR